MRVAVFGLRERSVRCSGRHWCCRARAVDGRESGPEGCDVAVDFTRPDAVLENLMRCLDHGVAVVIGTTGFDARVVDNAARHAGVPCFHAPNFSLGAVLMMRFAEEAARTFPEPRSSSCTPIRSWMLHPGRRRRRPRGWEPIQSSIRFVCPDSSRTRR